MNSLTNEQLENLLKLSKDTLFYEDAETRPLIATALAATVLNMAKAEAMRRATLDATQAAGKA